MQKELNTVNHQTSNLQPVTSNLDYSAVLS